MVQLVKNLNTEFETALWDRGVVLEKTLESPLDSNQSALKEINPEYSLEELMLKLETPTIWPPDAKD